MVQSPQRYIGGELNSIKKDWEGRLSLALAFPEPYELGMSHTGYRIIYHLVNREYNLLAERVFMPGEDMIELLRSRDIPLFSLESHRPVIDFDVLGFSLQTELSYTNILAMLELSDIPLHTKDRSDEHPIVIAGGPVALNPEPLADFIDVFFIGDAEAGFIDMLNSVKATKGKSRADVLRGISSLPGVYVPSLYIPAFSDGKQTGFETELDAQVKRQYVPELKSFHYPSKPIVPWMDIVHDRLATEIMRGCSRGCRFCLAGYIYRPVRERSADDVIEEVKKAVENSGLEEVGLLSLSSTDYSPFEEVVTKLKPYVSSKHISLALPSIRPEELTDALFEALQTERKGGITMAPEAATPRLRAVINKPSDPDEIYHSIDKAVSKGWKRIKLYFMIGLPTETDNDVLAIVDMIEEIWKRLKRAGGRLHVSVSPFVPKAHTPFQWEEQISPDEIQRREDLVYHEVKRRGLKIKLDTRRPFTSWLEGIFARGDRRLGDVLLAAYRHGTLFDGWDELRDETAWDKAFEETGIDPAEYRRERFEDEFLPWEMIDPGYSKESLLRERKRAYQEKYTPDCRKIRCENCDRCDFPSMQLAETKQEKRSSSNLGFGRRQKRIQRRDIFANWNFVRLRYTRTGRLRFLSHLDMGRILRRAIRRSGLPVAYTQGYNRHEKIAFGPPLPIGYSSIAEYLDIHLMSQSSDEDFHNFSKEFPEGMMVVDKHFLAAGKMDSLTGITDSTLIRVLIEGVDCAELEEKLTELMQRAEIIYERPRKELDIKPLLHSFKRVGNAFYFVTELSNNGSGRPEEYIELCGINPEDAGSFDIMRMQLLSHKNGTDPFGKPIDVKGLIDADAKTLIEAGVL